MADTGSITRFRATPQQSSIISALLFFASELVRGVPTVARHSGGGAVSYSVREAAAAVGRQKAAIIKAIAAGKISAERDAHGRWRLEPAELFRVYDPVPVKSAEPPEPDTIPDTAPDTVPNGSALLRQELKFLREKLADQQNAADRECRRLSDQVNDLQSERADLKSERDKLLKLLAETSGALKTLTDQRQSPAPDPPAAAAPLAPPSRRWFGGWRRS